ncbi:F-actin-capping protein [Gaertneriomyces sp. JEL0708]|nr:F-actin-capping protein [Gaertneriomyces sp. JEL0708]
MSELTEDQKLAIVSGFLRDSPPGEINNVFNDVRTLVDDDTLLQRGATEAFETYNTEQFVTVPVPGAEGREVILCKYGRLDGRRYLDPHTSQSFTVDHIRLTTADPEPVSTEGRDERLRHALDEASTAYVKDHYAEGVASVFEGEEIAIAIVSNKYSPNNFWNGRWRSLWVTQPGSSSLLGTLKVNVHYYEDGNVQLTSSKELTISVSESPDDPQAFASAALKLIAKTEAEFQTSLSESFNDLAGSVFKNLRRPLPITRNKINWDSIATYKLGNELSAK